MMSHYSAIVIGASAGGLYALIFLLEKLPYTYPIPLIVVQHRSKDQVELLEEVLRHKCTITIKQADEKEKIDKGIVYVAPPGYHLLIEKDMTFSLSSDEHVLSKPSIDILFESAAEVFHNKLVGIILTGANSDGANGIAAVKKNYGLTIAQLLQEAQYPAMPQAAINTGKVERIWTLHQIRNFLLELATTLENEKNR
jgi:two-component system chemotaxis response regulator CheB